MTTTREDRTTKFREKNERRKAHRDDPGAERARALRQRGIHRKVKETIPTDLGEDIVIETEIQGVPGAFGWASRQDWNERTPGTSGEDK